MTFDEVRRLDEHSAGAAGRIEDVPVERFDDLHDQPHYRLRGEELARSPAFGQRELAEEVLVDPAEGVSLEIPGVAVDVPEQGGEGFAADRRVAARQDPGQIRVVVLDLAHRLVDRLAEAAAPYSDAFRPELARSSSVTSHSRFSSSPMSISAGILSEVLVLDGVAAPFWLGRSVSKPDEPRTGPVEAASVRSH